MSSSIQSLTKIFASPLALLSNHIPQHFGTTPSDIQQSYPKRSHSNSPLPVDDDPSHVIDVKPPQNVHNPTISEKYLSNHKLNDLFTSKYHLGEELGSGGFGFVVSAYCRTTHQEVAVKFILKEKIAPNLIVTDPILGKVPMEVMLLHKLSHENIVSFIDYYQDSLFFYLITELHGTPWGSSIDNQPQIKKITRRSSCDLFECIEHHQRFTEKQAKIVFRQIVEAISYLHSLNIVHRDIKDENILVDSKMRVKLIDFGSAAVGSDATYSRFLGTVQYASPEILRGEPYIGNHAEIWSLGCCLFIMLTGSPPFDNPEQAMNSSYAQPLDVGDGCELSEDCLELVRWMLEKDVSRRARIEDVVEHAWVRANENCV